MHRNPLFERLSGWDGSAAKTSWPLSILWHYCTVRTITLDTLCRKMQYYTISLLLLQQSSTLSTLCRITLLHTIHYKNIALLQYLRLLRTLHCDKIALTLATKTCWLVWPVDPSPTHSLALFWHKRREPYHTVTLLHSLHYNTVALLQKCIHCTLTGLHNLTATILHCCTIWLLTYCTVAQFDCYHIALLHLQQRPVDLSPHTLALGAQIQSRPVWRGFFGSKRFRPGFL